MTKKVNVEKGKQGFQPTAKTEASSFLLGPLVAADNLNDYGHFTDSEFRAVRTIVAEQFTEAAEFIRTDAPEVGRVVFRIEQDEPGFGGYRISDITCYDHENLDLEDSDVHYIVYEDLCGSLSNHTRSLLVGYTGIGVTASNGYTELLVSDPSERLR